MPLSQHIRITHETESIETLLRDKYYLKNEKNWKDIAKRVAYLSPELGPEIYPYIESKTYMPSTPTLLNANTNGERQGTLSSCFIIDIEDDMKAIMESITETAIITQKTGGVGANFSKLRSSKEHVKSTGRLSGGPLPFIGIYNATLNGVRQGGARFGAGMVQLNINHGDIDSFISAKHDLVSYKRTNFSIGMYNRFYKTLMNNPDEIVMYKEVTTGQLKPLMQCIDGKDTPYTHKQLWDKITYEAWYSGDPGLFNLDYALDRCTCKHKGTGVYSNPCLTGDTLIAVADGRGTVSIKQLADEGKDVPVYTLNHQGEIIVKPMINPRKTREIADIYEVEFDTGLKVKCTDNHKFLSTSGNLIETKDLQIGESIKSIIKHQAQIKEIHPWMKRTSGQDYYFIENNGKSKAEHRIISEFIINRQLKYNEVVHHNDYDGLNNSLDNLKVMTNKEHINFHKKDMLGKNNSVFKIKDVEAWKNKISKHNIGAGNPNYSGLSDIDIITILKTYKDKFHGYICYSEWIKLGLPIINNTTKSTFRKHIHEYCNLAGLEYIPGNVFFTLRKQQINLETSKCIFTLNKTNREFIIHRICETCGATFDTNYEHRQATFCSQKCMAAYSFKPFRIENGKFSERYLTQPNIRRRIEESFNLFNLYRNGTYSNFKKEIHSANSLIRPTNLFAPSVQFIKDNINTVKTVEDLIKLAENNITTYQDKYEISKAVGLSYNHKVVSIKYIGREAVYDGTVEETHTILVGGKEFTNQWGKTSREFVVTGQCAEFIHLPYTSCNLASLNLLMLLHYGKINYSELDKVTQLGTRFQNYVIDCNKFPLEKIKMKTLATRPIGIGMMGLGSLLYKMKIPYNSQKAYELAAYLMKRITLVSMRESVNLAKIYGPYPDYDYNTFMDANRRYFENNQDVDFLDMKQLKQDIEQYGCYNSSQTSEAPNGSIGTIADVTTGIEPVYALSMERKVEKADSSYKVMTIIDPIFDAYLDTNYKDKKEYIYNYIEDHNGSCQGCPDLSPEDQKIFVTALDMTPMEHLEMTAGVAKWVSLSVSKTINLPNKATKEQIGEVYLEAWKRGIIGVTVYRDGSRKQILTAKGSVGIDKIPKVDAPKRPIELPADLHHITVDKVKYYVAVGLMGKDPFEVFYSKNYDEEGEVFIPKNIQKGIIRRVERGHYLFVTENNEQFRLCSDNSSEAITRLISWGLRHGGDNKYAVHQLEKTKGTLNTMNKIIARCLKKYIEDGTQITGEECPNCKSTNLIREAGCKKCIDCNTTLCG